jgi:hypothetical protein
MLTYGTIKSSLCIDLDGKKHLAVNWVIEFKCQKRIYFKERINCYDNFGEFSLFY